MDLGKGNTTTTIHALARRGDLDGVKKSVSNGGDADRKDCFGRTPLQYAAWQGRLPVVEYLLRQKANTEITDKEGITPLLSATLTGNLQLLDCLLAYGAKAEITDIYGRTPIHLATLSQNSVPILTCLLSHGANVDMFDEQGSTPLHSAALGGNLEAVKYLLSMKADVKIPNNHGSTPLHSAALGGNLEAVKYLLSMKADITIPNNHGETALFLATSKGSVDVVQCLVDNGADPGAKNDKGVTCLAVALEADNIKLAKCLIYAGADIHTLDKVTMVTPLDMAVKHEDIELVKWLIQNNTDVNAANQNQNTALHVASSRNNVEICEFLLTHGANIETRNKNNMTPVMIACLNNSKEVMKLLVSHNANIEAKGNLERTALHMAAESTATDVVEILISHKADIEALDTQKRTPLHLASYEQRIAVVECLLNHDANIEATDVLLFTPLHLCLISRTPNLEVATALVSYGADISTKNAKMETPYDLAEKKNHRFILSMFKKELQTGLPREMRYLKVDDADSFKKALRSGFYFSYMGKIMIVGNEGVGKTAITSIIIGRRPSKLRKSTEGIDVHISRAAVDLESRKLISKDLSVEDIAYRNLVMRKKYGRTSEEASLDDTLMNDREDDQMFFDEKLDSLATSNKNKENQPDSGFSHDTNKTTDDAQEAKGVDELVLSKLMKKLRPDRKEKDTITANMLKEGTIKAGKKGIHMMNFAPVIILDFAGQRVFYSTHQSFLTHRGIYILTVNGSFCLDDEIKTESPIPGKYGKPTTRAYIKFWVSSILTYSKGRNKMFPKILICCTHKDHVSVERLDEQRSFIFMEVAKMFEGTPAMDHLVLKHQIFINAMDPEDPEIQVLKDALVDMMFEQPSWGEKIPKSWIHLEMMINKKVAKGKKIMHLKQLEEINSENPVQSLSRKDLDIFLKVHHAQGDIIHFPLPGLRDHIIIYPAYLVNVLRSIVTEKSFCRGKRLDMIESMNRDGILRKSDIDKIWKTNRQVQHHQEYLMSLMSHLDILSEPRIYHPHTGKLLPSKFYFVPSLITKEDLTYYSDQENLCGKSLGLSFKFHSAVLPPAVGFRFISCCIEMWEVESYHNQRMLFTGMAVVVINKSLTMLVQVKEQRVDIFLIHETSRFQIVPDIASRIRECLNDTLYRISDSYKLSSAGTEAETESVPFHTEYTCFHVNSPCYTEQITEWVCENHGDHLGETLKKWIVDRTIDECPHDCKGVVQGALEEVPSELQLSKLVLQVSWDDLRTILLHLGMKVNEIKAVEVDYSNTILNIMFICLRKWRLKTRNGTLKDIYTAMEASETNVHALCKVFRDKPLDVPYEILERDATDQDLDMLATHIIDESLLLSVQLCIDASCWLEMKEDGHKIVNINRVMLRKWRNEHPGKPKMRELAQALSNVGINIGVFLSESP